MLARAVVAFLLLPGMVAFVVPMFLLRPVSSARVFHLTAIAPLTVGTVLLLWCVRDFYVSGRARLPPGRHRVASSSSDSIDGRAIRCTSPSA